MKYLKGNLNEEGVKQLIKLHQELHKEIKRIMDDEKNRGDILCCLMGVIGISQDKNPKTTE